MDLFLKRKKETSKVTFILYLDLLFDKPHLLMSPYEDYLNDGTELTLKSDLVKILKKETKNIQNC